MKYQAFSINNFEQIKQVKQFLSKNEKHAIKVLGNVLPFKVNNYVLDELIDWHSIPDDPIFQLVFPQREMLTDEHFSLMENTLERELDKASIQSTANRIREQLNPHPAGQIENIPTLDGNKLTGIQHKYRETLLFFPSNSQTCHAYCTFCFRWPQFVGLDSIKFAMRETDLLIEYLENHPEVTDVLFTGGDPMVMTAERLSSYIDPLVNQGLSNLQNIRIGTKSLSYWPYRFLTDSDSDDIFRLFESIVNKGYHLAIMAHFNHPRELQTEVVREAIRRIRSTGAEIRTQAPVMKHINDDAQNWIDMWKEQVKLGCIPYYMFVARDTGAQDYFALPLEEIWNIYHKAYSNISGITRTVKGPVMSSNPGKVQVLGCNEIMGQKLFTLRFIQARNPEFVNKTFFAKYDSKAIWLDDLEPAFGEDLFFFEEELGQMTRN